MNSSKNRKILKLLCISSITINILSIFLSFFKFSLVDNSLHKLLEYDAIDYMLPLSSIWPIFIFTTIATTIPLFYIYKGNITAFKIFSLGIVVTILSNTLSGIRVSIPIENFLGMLIYISWGGIFFIALLDDDLKNTTPNKH